MNLAHVGWTVQRQEAFSPLQAQGLIPGRVVGEHRSHFQVVTPAGEVSAEAPIRLRKAADVRSDLPGVGDFVALRPATGDGVATIEVVLQRSTALIRKASGEERPQLLAANIDIVFVVTAPDGDLNLPRIERYLALVRESGAKPVIILNKADLDPDPGETTAKIAAIAPDVAIHAISARHPDCIGTLEPYFADCQTIALIGSSGVGKSTLTNQLLGRLEQATQEVRAHDSRGRHTTTRRQLFAHPRGGAFIDTPGLRGLELWNAPIDLAGKFDDIDTLASQCRFRNCRHDGEPGCAVRAAVERGEIERAHFDEFHRTLPADVNSRRR